MAGSVQICVALDFIKYSWFVQMFDGHLGKVGEMQYNNVIIPPNTAMS